MPERFITLTAATPLEPRAERFARGEEVEPPPPIVVRLPGLPPRKVNEIKSKT